MTPHIAAEMGDFAKTVLMPGDPKRSAYIAEHFLEAPKLVNDLRCVQGYTGYYKDVPVSVMASGMGIPSISIYAHELYTFFGVENIIRVGTAGALRADMPLGTVVAGMAACTDSNVMSQLGLDAVFAPTADFMLLANAVRKSRELGMNMSVGSLYSTDLFYDDLNRWKKMADLGVLAIEMEAAGLYLTAAQTGQKALAICSISDNMITGVAMDGKERESAFRDMMIIALETAKAMDKLPVA